MPVRWLRPGGNQFLMNNNNNHHVLARLLDQAYMEVIPTKSIVDRLIHIPRHSYVSITCSPVHGLEPTLKLVEKLRALPEERQFKGRSHGPGNIK